MKTLKVLAVMLMLAGGAQAQNQPIFQISHPKELGFAAGGFAGMADGAVEQNRENAIFCYQYPNGALRNADFKIVQCADWAAKHKGYMHEVEDRAAWQMKQAAKKTAKAGR